MFFVKKEYFTNLGAFSVLTHDLLHLIAEYLDNKSLYRFMNQTSKDLTQLCYEIIQGKNLPIKTIKFSNDRYLHIQHKDLADFKLHFLKPLATEITLLNRRSGTQKKQLDKVKMASGLALVSSIFVGVILGVLILGSLFQSKKMKPAEIEPHFFFFSLSCVLSCMLYCCALIYLQLRKSTTDLRLKFKDKQFKDLSSQWSVPNEYKPNLV